MRAKGHAFAEPVWDDPAVDWSTFTAVLIRTTWDYMERRDEFVAWAERVADVTALYNPPDVIRWNTHKAYLRDLQLIGIPVIPTVWLDRGAPVSIEAILEVEGWPSVFIKPAVGATARETVRARTGEDLGEAQAHLDRTLTAEDMLVQPYLPSVETFGEVSAIYIDGALSHGVRKVPVAGDYRVQDDFGAHDEPFEFTGADLDVVEHAIDAAGARGLLYARIDLLRADTGNLLVNELELVEPSLFFRHAPEAAERLADALVGRAGVDNP